MALKRLGDRRDDALSRVNWKSLETLLASHYRAEGYVVEHVGTGGTGSRYDGGIDLKLRRGDEYVLVQVKHWNVFKVPHNDVHQLLGVMVNEGATGAILVTSGEFTQAAVEAATRQGHVQLIDGQALRMMLGPACEALVAEASASRGVEAFAAAVDLRDRPVRPRRPSPHRPGAAQSWWWVFALVGIAIFAFLIHSLLKQTAWSAGEIRLDDAGPQAQVAPPSGEHAQHVVAAPASEEWDAGRTRTQGPAIYKCVGAGQAVSYQSTPCEGGTHAASVRPYSPEREPTRAERARNEARWATRSRSGSASYGTAANIPLPPQPNACDLARAERAAWERSAGLNRSYDQVAYWNNLVAKACY